MIEHIVVASSGKGALKKEIGRKVIQLPESVEEMVDQFEEATILKYFNASFKLDTLSDLRGPALADERKKLLAQNKQLMAMARAMSAMPFENVVEALENANWSEAEIGAIISISHPDETYPIEE